MFCCWRREPLMALTSAIALLRYEPEKITIMRGGPSFDFRVAITSAAYTSQGMLTNSEIVLSRCLSLSSFPTLSKCEISQAWSYFNEIRLSIIHIAMFYSIPILYHDSTIGTQSLNFLTWRILLYYGYTSFRPRFKQICFVRAALLHLGNPSHVRYHQSSRLLRLEWALRVTCITW